MASGHLSAHFMTSRDRLTTEAFPRSGLPYRGSTVREPGFSMTGELDGKLCSSLAVVMESDVNVRSPMRAKAAASLFWIASWTPRSLRMPIWAHQTLVGSVPARRGHRERGHMPALPQSQVGDRSYLPFAAQVRLATVDDGRR